MALEAVVLSQAGLFGRRTRCAMAGAGGAWNSPFGGVERVMDLDGGNWDAELLHGFQELDIPAAAALLGQSGGRGEDVGGVDQDAAAVAAPDPAGRRKRRRTRTAKNKEEMESQRMTHIAVERNRRRQMNEYLAVLRSLMPPSYAQRGDQASIVGGAINFVKELEQLLQSLEGQKRSRQCAANGGGDAASFANFFTFPQYSMSAITAAPAAWNEIDRDGGGVEARVQNFVFEKNSFVAEIAEITEISEFRYEISGTSERALPRGARIEAVGGGRRRGDHGGEPRQPAGAVPPAAEEAAAAGGGAAGPPAHRAAPQHDQRRPHGALLV